MDKLFSFGPLTDNKIMDFIEANIPDFRSYSEKDRLSMYNQVRQYLERKQFSAMTFEEYGLRGTPSSILIDKTGVLRQTVFGSDGLLESSVERMLNE
jgi:hypothetical protein